MFSRKGTINIPRGGKNASLTEDDLLGLILDAGADDLQTDSDSFTVTTAPQAFDAVRKALEEKGIAVENASLSMVAHNTVKSGGKDAEQLLKLMEALEEHDDVQNVYANFDIDDKELAALGA
jgi:transcriptional/translational regulatory protein YebC/TACO1